MTSTPLPNQPSESDELDRILYRFADYIRHHAKTGLGGEHSQYSTKQAIQALYARQQSEAEDRVIEIAHKPCECGQPHYATPVRSVQGSVTSYCQFSRVTTQDTTNTKGGEDE